MKLRIILALMLGMSGSIIQAQEQENGQSRLKNQEPSAEQREENALARTRSKNIRRAISQDKSISSFAHNIRVIRSWKGTVTLKGPVNSEEERQSVEAKAAEIAGPDNINSEIFVEAEAHSSVASR